MNFEEAKTLVEQDIKIKLNTYLSYIDEYLNIKENLKEMAYEHLSQQTVPLAAKWKIATSLGMVDDNVVSNILFTGGEMIDEDALKEEIINDLINRR